MSVAAVIPRRDFSSSLETLPEALSFLIFHYLPFPDWLRVAETSRSLREKVISYLNTDSLMQERYLKEVSPHPPVVYGKPLKIGLCYLRKKREPLLRHFEFPTSFSIDDFSRFLSDRRIALIANRELCLWNPQTEQIELTHKTYLPSGLYSIKFFEIRSQKKLLLIGQSILHASPSLYFRFFDLANKTAGSPPLSQKQIAAYEILSSTQIRLIDAKNRKTIWDLETNSLTEDDPEKQVLPSSDDFIDRTIKLHESLKDPLPAAESQFIESMHDSLEIRDEKSGSVESYRAFSYGTTWKHLGAFCFVSTHFHRIAILDLSCCFSCPADKLIKTGMDYASRKEKKGLLRLNRLPKKIQNRVKTFLLPLPDANDYALAIAKTARLYASHWLDPRTQSLKDLTRKIELPDKSVYRRFPRLFPHRSIFTTYSEVARTIENAFDYYFVHWLDPRTRDLVTISASAAAAEQ